jgi:hypothetical protein
MDSASNNGREEFLELPNGIPSDDTFRRAFEKLDPKVFS